MKGQSTKRFVDKIIIHCSDTYARMDVDADEIRRWHVKERGWADIGYHFIIRRDGTVQTGRDMDKDGDIYEEIGAHVAGWNRNSIGICMIGGKGDNGKAENNFTDRQFHSLETLVRVIKADYPKSTVHGHREFQADKQCPSFDVQEWVMGRKL